MRLSGIRAVVLDIEGTVGPIAFVRDVLFPYARQRYTPWLAALPAAERAELLASIGAAAGNPVPDGASAVAALIDWTDRDVKTPILKSVQSRIWHAGFADGALRSDAYPDVAPALRRWKAQGLRLFVYSSGAEQAQRDWFGHTGDGDLRPLLDGYFDLDSAGSKKESASYAAIAAAIGVSPAAIAFCTDAPAEVEAATAAGWRAVRVDREGGPRDADGVVDSLRHIVIETTEVGSDT